jgi:hypothetical protein
MQICTKIVYVVYKYHKREMLKEQIGRICKESAVDRAQGTFLAGVSYLCTYDLYSPVHNAFDAGSIHYDGKWEGVGPWKSRLF